MRQIVIEQGSGSMTAWLALSGAVIVAGIAAITAHVRLMRQLAAETDRLDAQLAHERHLHDLGEYRAVLDDAAASLWQVRIAWNTSLAMTRTRRKAAPGEVKVDAHARQKDVLEAWNAALELMVPLQAQHVRLVVRFGRQHPVAEAFDAAWDAFADIPRYEWPIDDEALRAIADAVTRATAKVFMFLDRAQELAGARLATAPVHGQDRPPR